MQHVLALLMIRALHLGIVLLSKEIWSKVRVHGVKQMDPKGLSVCTRIYGNSWSNELHTTIMKEVKCK